MTNLATTILLAASLGLALLTTSESTTLKQNDTAVCGEPTGSFPPPPVQ